MIWARAFIYTHYTHTHTHILYIYWFHKRVCLCALARRLHVRLAMAVMKPFSHWWWNLFFSALKSVYLSSSHQLEFIEFFTIFPRRREEIWYTVITKNWVHLYLQINCRKTDSIFQLILGFFLNFFEEFTIV